MAKTNSSFLLLAILISSMIPAVVAQVEDEIPYGSMNTETDFEWVLDSVEYDHMVSGVPGGTKFHRLTVFIPKNDDGETMFRYTIHIANDSNNALAGRMFQWITFTGENEKDWNIHLHQDGYHLDDEQGGLPHLAGHADVEYMKNNPESGMSQGVISTTLVDPKIEKNAKGITEITWSVIEHRICYQTDGSNHIIENENHTAKMKTTWHIYVEEENGTSNAIIKQDFMVYDVQV